jgi:hypothetical protein
MSRILIRQGEGPEHAYNRIINERQADRKAIERILAEPVEDTTKPTKATAGGDERKLRGIPAIGRGVAGAIPGTRPGQNIK